MNCYYIVHAGKPGSCIQPRLRNLRHMLEEADVRGLLAMHGMASAPYCQVPALSRLNALLAQRAHRRVQPTDARNLMYATAYAEHSQGGPIRPRR